MLKEDEIVTARVVRIEQYGAYLEYAGASILVLGPDASPTGDIPVERIFKVDDEARVRVGRYSSTDNAYRGYIK